MKKILAPTLLFSLLLACSSCGFLPLNTNEDKTQKTSSVTSFSHQQQTSSDIDRRYAALLELYTENGKERDLDRARQLTAELKMAYPPDHYHQEVLDLIEIWTAETLAGQNEINALKGKVRKLQQEVVRQEQALEMIRRSLVIQ